MVFSLHPILAATIAAMEWNSKPFAQQSNTTSNKNNNNNNIQISAHAIGFGCPALLSHPLSLATKPYITSVIADADFIPRMSDGWNFVDLSTLKASSRFEPFCKDVLLRRCSLMPS